MVVRHVTDRLSKWIGGKRQGKLPAKEIAIVHDAANFSHPDACRIFDLAMRRGEAQTVVVDLKRAEHATTSAFARLVLLRRSLLRRGRDLRLVGLRGGTARVYEINRLGNVLPTL
jgi:hypothetical protein